LLQTALAALHKEGYELYRPQLSVTLTEGVAKTGERELAYSTICEAVTWAETRARERGLLSLELRTGISLATLWADRAQRHKALELLDPIFNRVSEGF
jgi:hypothetical protein